MALRGKSAYRGVNRVPAISAAGASEMATTGDAGASLRHARRFWALIAMQNKLAGMKPN